MGSKEIHKLTSVPDTGKLIVGIASHENDYRISWALNNALGINLMKSDNLMVFNKRFNENQEFSMYTSNETDSYPCIKLIANRCNNGFLIDELRNLDYFLLLESEDKPLDKSGLIQKIRLVPFISTAFEINPSSVKGISRVR